MPKDLVLSGVQPTGDLHLGNYLGAFKQWLELQKDNKCIYCVVDYHAMTIDYNPKTFHKQILDTALDFLAIGVDPKKSIIFIQSQVPEHTELAWIFNTLTPISELERMTQYKEKSYQQQENVNVGIFDYPVLMAADILLYKPTLIPVGEDQAQHVELTRNIARKFNLKFGETFIEPKVTHTKGARIMSLADPTKKMSKSLGPAHYIALNDPPEVIRKKVRNAITTSDDKIMEKCCKLLTDREDYTYSKHGSIDVHKSKENIGEEYIKQIIATNNLFILLDEFTDRKTYNVFLKNLKNRDIQFSKLKEVLSEAIIKSLKPFQDRRKKLANDPNTLQKILDDGAAKAKTLAEKTMADVRKKIGIR